VSSFRVAYNGLAVGAVADLDEQTCQPAQMPKRSTVFDLTTKPAIALNACYGLGFIRFKLSFIF